MFDEIVWDNTEDLPDLPPEMQLLHQDGRKPLFQTKSLENGLDRYRVTDAGRLLLQHCENKIVREGNPEGKTFSERFPVIETVKEEWVKCNYTGTIEFYDSYNYAEKLDCTGWVEYRATFVEGLLQNRPVLVTHTLPRNFTEEEIAEHRANYEYWKKRREEVFKKKIETVEQARKRIAALGEVQDALYVELLEDLGLDSSIDKEACDWVFDYLFNGGDLEKIKEVLS